ncbi:hypothetical protein P3T76_008551 [Phytophthora citrophthora]|uniref:DDE-1 domain-containing protein n=1 Tax=Phytophthora citrophthora TaxID=4793 RepID=A0AAD9GIR5_9STRA|nr:hypothetical protein P3T76_008551 [Phytophthora citrophthora]
MGSMKVFPSHLAVLRYCCFITFMKGICRGSQPLTASIMASYVRDEHAEWLEDNLKEKKDAATTYKSLLRFLRRFAYRYGFVQRTPHALKDKLEDVEAMQADFAKFYKSTNSVYKPSEVFNCDETGIYFDMPLSLGGSIEKEELPTHPDGHVYTVQSKPWMDTQVWKFYLRSLLSMLITEPSLLLVDNLDCHVSDASEAIVSEELNAMLQPLPKNTSEKRLAMIRRTITAWESIAAETFSSAFNKELSTQF